jgi:uncharacterized Zn-binding protein involved in type VI secretion
MAAAARIGDTTDHGGSLIPPGFASQIFIEGMPAAVAGDLHKCSIPPPSHTPVSPITAGSGTVFMGGFPAARTTDRTGCGAGVVVGATSVQIGG